ncbi:MAG: UDP-N-acetylglucosamine transferase subunit [Stictis urceolatum]|nr:UDP-N-acetylglucosamine transferase subunit [Stictis urceolata]
MLLLLRDLDTASYTFRRYVISSGDDFSAQKAIEFEKTLAHEARRSGKLYGDFDIKTVARARQIHQSLLSTPMTAAKCMWDCICVLRSLPVQRKAGKKHKVPYPDLIMANGPATATIMVFASLVVRFLGLKGASGRMRCIYVESWARVKTPSLSGRILSITGACDRLLVQWATLANRGFEFRGQMVA